MDELETAQRRAELAEARALLFEHELAVVHQRLIAAHEPPHEEPEIELQSLPQEALQLHLAEHAERRVKLSGYIAHLQAKLASAQETRAPLERDALTGLWGPAYLQGLLNDARGTELAVVLVELERPLLTRWLGAEHADQLVRQAGLRLAGLVGPAETVGRWSDNQFLILTGSAEAAARLAERAVQLLREPLTLGEFHFHFALWAGAAAGPAEHVLKMAREALRHARRTACPFHAWGEELQEKARRRAAMLPLLAKAQAEKQFELHYQPLVEAATGTITGVEARLRWNHPQRGLLEARHFIDELEESGLILATDHWVLREACRELAVHDSLFLTINLSIGHLLLADLPTRVLELMGGSGINPARVCLELPELGLEMAPERVGLLTRELSRAGVGVAIDGFGTRLSSLGGLPVRFVKLDSSLVASLAQPESQRLCQAALALAKGLEIQVVAKGVETAQQASWLRSAGCQLLEGHFLSPPVPAARLKELAKRRWSAEMAAEKR